MSDERILMKNPKAGSEGTRIRVDMFEPVRDAILTAINDHGSLPFSDLRAEVEARTPVELWNDASPGWYTTTVKLHLEATDLLSRSGSPQILTLTDAGRAALKP